MSEQQKKRIETVLLDGENLLCAVIGEEGTVLKPCPFCGAAAEWHSQTFKKHPLKMASITFTHWTVYCPTVDCFCSLTWDRDDQCNFLFETQEQAAEAWNKRADQ